MSITFDNSNLKKKAEEMVLKVEEKTKQAVSDVATEVLRLSEIEVPHDKGTLQNSGHVEPSSPSLEMLVGYNTVYAARLHEHPEYNFQAGRKGKYLEDPIKQNLHVFTEYFKKVLTG